MNLKNMVSDSAATSGSSRFQNVNIQNCHAIKLNVILMPLHNNVPKTITKRIQHKDVLKIVKSESHASHVTKPHKNTFFSYTKYR